MMIPKALRIFSLKAAPLKAIALAENRRQWNFTYLLTYSLPKENGEEKAGKITNAQWEQQGMQHYFKANMYVLRSWDSRGLVFD